MTTTEQRPTASDVTHRLRDLGPTAGEVADSLFYLGVRGYPGSSLACPVATYLHQNYPAYAWLVSSTEISSMGSEVSIKEDFPRSVSDFIEEFDEGRYSELYPPEFDHTEFLAHL